MSIHRLPPLNALRAFEAAARHGGYIGAAEELHVTRGAISRHVKLLEDRLGVALFRRHAKGLDLTEAGRTLLPVLTEAFGQIAGAAERITEDASLLRIICPPATSIRWLIPRLDDFRTRHPEVRLRLTTDFYSRGQFARSEYDVGFSVTEWPDRARDLEVQPLFPVVLAPACAPALAARLADPADLSRTTLLHETPDRHDWTAWLKRFGDGRVDAQGGDNFPNLDMAVKAAVMGSGVVMADLALCRDELASGALVMPFPEMTCPGPYGAICLIGPSERWQEPRVAAFRNWAVGAAARDADALPA